MVVPTNSVKEKGALVVPTNPVKEKRASVAHTNSVREKRALVAHTNSVKERKSIGCSYGVDQRVIKHLITHSQIGKSGNKKERSISGMDRKLQEVEI